MTDLTSTVAEVVVFPDRARVTRRGSLALDAGTQSIAIVDLPLSVQPESIRAAGRGTANAVLLGVDVRRVFYAETPAAAVHDLEQQIEALTLEDKALIDRTATLNTQLSFVKGLADKSAEQLARGLAFGRAELGQGDTLLAFVQQQMDQTQTTLREIDRQRTELSRRLTKLNNDLNAHRSTQPRERYIATVEIEVKRAGDLTLDLTYLVRNAGWQALYDLRLSESDPPTLQLAYLGQVTQQTGEDWTDVQITLSTARPALATIKPELKPWYISEVVPLPAPMPRLARAAAPASIAAQAMSEGAAFGSPPPQMLMDVAEAHVNTEGATVTFTLAQTASIPSDGSPHKVNVTALDLSPRLDYLAVPKLAEAVYRRAKITNRSEYLLLPGQANLFVEGDFIGTLPLERVAPNEEFEIALGVDDRIVITRELKAREVDKKLIGDRRRLHMAYEIEAQNLRDRAIDLEVRDQVPVSRHEQIKVKLETVDPKPIEHTELNELGWRLALAPQAKQTCRFDFTIEHPAIMQVMGLP